MSFRRILNWAVGLPLAIVAAAFAVANRQWITVSFDPLSRAEPFAAVTMPLWVLFFCGIFVGLFAGWLAAWLAQAKWRRAAREARLELMRARQDHEKTRREVPPRAAAFDGDAGL